MTSDQVDKAATLTVDISQTFQTIQGMGTFETNPLVADEFIDMGGSAVRLGVIGNQLEWENDNDDPFVLNMEALDHSAWDFDYLRYLKRQRSGEIYSYPLERPCLDETKPESRSDRTGNGMGKYG